MKQVGFNYMNPVRRSKIHKMTILSQWDGGLCFAFYLVQCKSLIHRESYIKPFPVPFADKEKVRGKLPCLSYSVTKGRKIWAKSQNFWECLFQRLLLISPQGTMVTTELGFPFFCRGRELQSPSDISKSVPSACWTEIPHYTSCNSKSNHQTENNQGILTPSTTLGSPRADCL